MTTVQLEATAATSRSGDREQYRVTLEANIPAFCKLNIAAPRNSAPGLGCVHLWKDQQIAHLLPKMDKYTLEEKIGEGSYAIVYRASKSGKPFAIKALKDDYRRCAVPGSLCCASDTAAVRCAALTR